MMGSSVYLGSAVTWTAMHQSQYFQDGTGAVVLGALIIVMFIVAAFVASETRERDRERRKAG